MNLTYADYLHVDRLLDRQHVARMVDAAPRHPGGRVLVRSGNSRSTQLQKDFAKAMEPVEDLVREVLSESVNSVATELPFQDPRWADHHQYD